MYTNSVFSSVKMEFFHQIANNVTLEYLDISNTHLFDSNSLSKLSNLAHAVAFNAENKGSLTHLFIDKINVNNRFSSFFTNLYVTN